MILYVDNENRIKSVNAVLPSLTPIEIDDTNNPFDGWSEAKICCYKVYTATVPVYPDPVEINDDEEPIDPEPIGTKKIIVGYTPYVDSRLLDHFDQVGSLSEENNDANFDLAELADENSNSIFDLAEYVAELEERVATLEGGK